MSSRLHFLVSEESQVWRELLPEELHHFIPSYERECFYLNISDSCWPELLVKTRNSFWDNIRDGGDPKDMSEWCKEDIEELFNLLGRTKGAVLTLLCPPPDIGRDVAAFLSASLRAGTEILGECNMQGGEIDSKLINAKRGIIAQIKMIVDSLEKITNHSNSGHYALGHDKKKKYSGDVGHQGMDQDFFDITKTEGVDMSIITEETKINE